MEDVTTPCFNTAKMLGANGREARDFADACFVLRNNINKELKSRARKTILATNLYGKTFETWLEEMHSVGVKHNNSLLPENQTQLMTLADTKTEFVYGVVSNILSTLITKQFHEKSN